MSSATQPSEPRSGTQPAEARSPQADPPQAPSQGLTGRELWRRVRWFLPVILVFAVVGGLAGYYRGLNDRQQTQLQAVRAQAQEQFDLGVEDLEAGRYEVARQRFEYVIRLDPSFPGAPERLAEALLVLNRPTQRPTPDASPTPNLAPIEELFDQARAALIAENWDTAIDTLLLLRQKDAGYQAVKVDSMMYLALRNRGVSRIANAGQLEEGIYDLALARQFGPLDRDAANWLSWAELYLRANTYMGVNWGQALSYFAQVYLVAPYLKNDAYIKYAISAQKYAEELVALGDPCAAEELFDESLLVWDNATIYPTATEARNLCRTATAPPPAPPQDTPTPDGAPTETPTPSETPPENG